MALKAKVECKEAFFVKGRCENGHQFLLGGGCDKEICEACGQVGSGGHLKRYSRWIGKILWMLKEFEVIGYMVITLPQEYWQKDKEFLKKFRRYVIRKLKRMGYKVGKSRYHWAGDRNRCFYPHLNILLAGRWIEKNDLEKMKQDIGKWLGYDDKVVLEYHYSRNIKKIKHWVWYITRPTLLLIEDEKERQEVWEMVKGFRNDIEWGKPKSLDFKVSKQDLEVLKEEVSEEEFKRICILNSICPYCQTKIKWKFTRERPDEFWIDLKDGVWEWRL